MPGVEDIDVYINDDVLAKNLAYKQMSKYLPIGPGKNTIQVFPAGDKTCPIINTEVDLPPSEVITLAATGAAPDFKVLPILQFDITVDPEQVKIRFAQLSSDAPRLDLFVDENKLFTDIEYEQVSDYTIISPETYNVQLRPSTDNDLILAEGNLEFKAGKAYTIYAVGLNDGTPPLEIIYYEEQLPVVNKKQVVKKEIPEAITKTLSSGGSSVKIIFRYV